MSKSERLDILMRRAIMENSSKLNGRLSNSQTIQQYRKGVDKFCAWAKDLGITREHQIRKQGYTPESFLQKYADSLAGKGLAATTIHTYLAPACKGLRVSMECIDKPSRLSKDIKKNTKLSQNSAGERQAAAPENARLVRLAQIVGIRPRALVRLTVNNLRVDENGDTIVAIRDKGGKESVQLLFPHEVKLVREILTTGKDGRKLKPNERPFSEKDLHQIAFSKYRIERAQEVERYFSKRFNGWMNMPRKSPKEKKFREEARAAAMKEKMEWVDKIVRKYAAAHPKASPQAIEKYRKQLLNPSRISLRGGNRERAKALGRPTDYDRVAVKIASVYALSHWEDESTIRNYLTK